MNQASSAIPALAADPLQYLTFMLGSDTFAIGILSIKEIIEYETLTTIPMAPPAIRGVINLRGAVVPVMDMQARFGRASSPTTKRTCIVIVETGTDGDGEPQVLGVLVDSVNEVIEIPAADIQPPPSFGTGLRSDFIQGVGKVRGGFVLLLAVDRALSTEMLQALSDVASV